MIPCQGVFCPDPYRQGRVNPCQGMFYPDPCVLPDVFYHTTGRVGYWLRAFQQFLKTAKIFGL